MFLTRCVALLGSHYCRHRDAVPKTRREPTQATEPVDLVQGSVSKAQGTYSSVREDAADLEESTAPDPDAIR